MSMTPFFPVRGAELGLAPCASARAASGLLQESQPENFDDSSLRALALVVHMRVDSHAATTPSLTFTNQ
jgi:hypothetical protein